MMEHFKSLGVSFKTTPLEVRESISLDEQSTRGFLKKCQEVLGISDLLVLSTCNRTEIYYLSDHDLGNDLIALLAIHKNISPEKITGYFNYYNDQDAVQHLFDVSLGLDSSVLGDLQITNQVKRAYQWSADEGLAGPVLHRLLHTIFFTNKRVVQETPFRDGTASLASVAVDLTKHFTSNFVDPKVVIIGLGEIGEDVAENLREFNGDITLINRSDDKSVQLAASLGFHSRPYSDMHKVIPQCDVVISAVNAPQPIILHNYFSKEKGHKMVIDLSVPRSVEEEVENIPGLLLYNVDQLHERTRGALEKRKAAIQDVKKIIQDSCRDFNEWSQEMEVSPVIQKFKNTLEDIRQKELARYVGKLDEKQTQLLDQATRNMIQKVIKLPVLQLKAACKRGEAETLVEVLNDLFNLEKDRKTVK